MKTKIIIGCLFSLLTTSVSYSQSAKEAEGVYAISANSETGRTITRNEAASADVTVKQKVQKSFSKNFTGTTGQLWQMKGEDFQTSFYKNGLLTCACFKKGGYLLYTIVYGLEENLPEDLRDMVKDQYSNYKITRTAELKQRQRNIWVVNLENNYNYVTVRLEDNNLDEMQKVKK